MEIQTQVLNEAKNELCRRDFIEYIKAMQPNYEVNWFHKVIAEKCQQLHEGKFNRLMLFMPPQHGKSTVVSRYFPSWVFGKAPNTKIVHASYSSDLVEGFSREIQRTIDSEEYIKVFPGTSLNNSNVRTNTKEAFIRTIEKFEIVGHNGIYKAVGVGGSLTGNPADLAIIDDPVKDALEASSEVYRNRLWDWYLNVLETRLHNNSKVLLIQTRWHHDDLAGRILSQEADKWHICLIPSIREDYSNNDDPREIGEALWPKRHSLEKLLRMKELSPRTFAALYQQRPTIESGNIIKREWFQFIDKSEFEAMQKSKRIDFFLDTAYTDKTSNDPSGIIGVSYIKGNIYIYCAKKMYLGFPELCKFIPNWTLENGRKHNSAIKIEPKASGISVIQQLKRETGLNIISTKAPKESKQTRLQANSPIVESGKIVLVRGSWNEEFISEICSFPSAKHDEFVDLLNYSIENMVEENERTYIRRIN